MPPNNQDNLDYHLERGYAGFHKDEFYDGCGHHYTEYLEGLKQRKIPVHMLDVLGYGDTLKSFKSIAAYTGGRYCFLNVDEEEESCQQLNDVVGSSAFGDMIEDDEERKKLLSKFSSMFHK